MALNQFEKVQLNGNHLHDFASRTGFWQRGRIRTNRKEQFIPSRLVTEEGYRQLREECSEARTTAGETSSSILRAGVQRYRTKLAKTVEDARCWCRNRRESKPRGIARPVVCRSSAGRAAPGSHEGAHRDEAAMRAVRSGWNGKGALREVRVLHETEQRLAMYVEAQLYYEMGCSRDTRQCSITLSDGKRRHNICACRMLIPRWHDMWRRKLRLNAVILGPDPRSGGLGNSLRLDFVSASPCRSIRE